MTPLEAMRDALEEVVCAGADDAAELIDALNRRNIILVELDPKVAPLFIQARDSGK